MINTRQAEKLKHLIESNATKASVELIKSGLIPNIDAQNVVLSLFDDDAPNDALELCDNWLRLYMKTEIPYAPKPRYMLDNNILSGNIKGVNAILERNKIPVNQMWHSVKMAIENKRFDIAEAILISEQNKSTTSCTNMAKHILPSEFCDIDFIPILFRFIVSDSKRIASSLGYCFESIVIDKNTAKFKSLLHQVHKRDLDIRVEEAITISMEHDTPEKYIDYLLPYADKIPEFDTLQIEKIYPNKTQKEFESLTPSSPEVKVALLVRWHIRTCKDNIISLMQKAPLWQQQYFLNELRYKNG